MQVDARRLLAVSRSLHPGRSLAAVAQTVYMTVLTLGLSAVLFWSLWQRVASFFIDVASPYRFIWGVGSVALVVVAALRYSTVQGFISYSEADCMFLLTAPVSREELIKPRLRRIVAVTTTGGALVGVLAGLASGGRAAGTDRMLLAVVAGAAMGAIVVEAGWHVQRLPRLSLWVRRLTLPALAVVALLAYADSVGGRAHLAALWSGPWGWGLLPLGAGAAWYGNVGVALLVIVAGAGWISVQRTAGSAPLEGFISRAQTRLQVTAAVYAMDARSLMLIAGRTSDGQWRARLRLRPPRHPSLVPAWHGLLVLLRSPLRLTWALVLGAVAPLLLGMYPGNTGMSFAAALALYLSASSLVEPLRLEVDQRGASATMLPWRFGKLVWLHCLLPTSVLLAVVLVAILIGWTAGFVSAPTVGALALLAVPATCVAVASAALSARRGGRLPEHLLLVSAGDSTGASGFLLLGWIFGWAILGIVAVALAALTLAGSIVFAYIASAAAAMLVVAAVLSLALLHTKR